MLAPFLSKWLDRRGIHFAWVIAAIVFLTMLTSSAALGLPGALMQPLSKEYGWNTEQISSALSVRFVLFGLMGPFAAILMERYGLRNVICTALALVATGLVLATRMTSFWQLVALWGIVLGLGSGMTALVLGAVVSNRWFDTHRGLVIGILTASSATGQLLFLPLAAWLIDSFGWRTAVIPVFFACTSVFVLAFLFMQNRPQELGLAPFGANPLTPVPPVARRMSCALPVPVASPATVRSGFCLRPYLWAKHQRSDPDALHLALRRRRPNGDSGSVGAGNDGRLRSGRHDPVGLAVGPV